MVPPWGWWVGGSEEADGDFGEAGRLGVIVAGALVLERGLAFIDVLGEDREGHAPQERLPATWLPWVFIWLRPFRARG